MSSRNTDLGNKPLIVMIGLISSIIGIVAFVSGKSSMGEFITEPSPIPSNPIAVTVVMEPVNYATSAPQVVVVTATSDQSSRTAPLQPVQSSPNLGPQSDRNDPEGFLRWYFREVWATRNYDDLWDYISVDFRQRLDQSFSKFESNWNAVGSIQEPIDITYEGKSGTSLKYRVQYTTLSRKSGYADRRRDLYWLYFNSSKGHWEFK